MVAYKISITEVEDTVVQPMHIAVTDKRAVIVCRCLFLLLFWISGTSRIRRGKKIKVKNIEFQFL